MTLQPLGPELRARNLRLIAERLHWPAGAIEACEAIDAAHPGWHTTYKQPWRNTEPAGYYAGHDNHWRLEPDMYGATPDELEAAIASHRCRRLLHGW